MSFQYSDMGQAEIEEFLFREAALLDETGLTEIAEIVVDDRVFDREYVHSTWPPDQLNRRYCAQVSECLREFWSSYRPRALVSSDYIATKKPSSLLATTNGFRHKRKVAPASLLTRCSQPVDRQLRRSIV